jgi:hypothetical protein
LSYREPAESFTDLDVIEEYRRKAGLDLDASPSNESVKDDKEAIAVARTASQMKNESTLQTRVSHDDSSDEAEYEVERIVSHHLSDPRTHPTGLGKSPVMLYRVKWKGYDELSWEPAASFGNSRILMEYNKRHSIPHANSGGGGGSDTSDEEDDEMEDVR